MRSTSLRRCRAPGAAPDLGREACSERRLAGARKPAYGDEQRRRRREIGARERRVAANFGKQLGLLRGLELLGARHRHDGAYGGTAGKEQRQAGKPLDLAADRLEGHVGVENDVCRLAVVARVEVHEQEGEIVQDVDGGQLLAELERIEGNGSVVDEDDVAEVEIAVAAAHAAGVAALGEQFRDALEGGDEGLRDIGMAVGERARQLLNDGREDTRAVAGVANGAVLVIARDHVGEGLGQLLAERVRAPRDD